MVAVQRCTPAAASRRIALNDARWDGTSWSSVGGGPTAVNAMIEYDDGSGDGLSSTLGGSFTTAGTVAANRVAKWDGTTWSALGSGVGGSYVLALAVYDDGSGPALYAGGLFTTGRRHLRPATSPSGTGRTWSALGSGVDSIVDVLVVYDGELYAGGDFDTLAVARPSTFAKWDGTIWSPLEGGVEWQCQCHDRPRDGRLTGPALIVSGASTPARR